MPDDVRAWLEYGGASAAAAAAAAAHPGTSTPAGGDSAEGDDDGDASAAIVSAEEAPTMPAAPEAEAEAPPDAAIFVHFIPPPMRENGKKDLSWIVHTCGSGCREARHVTFNSICGFSTAEGAPPEQVEGRACSCAIANHHLRGFGRVRWEGQDAIVEHHSGGGGGGVMVNVRAYRDDAKKNNVQLSRAREEIKRWTHARAARAPPTRTRTPLLRADHRSVLISPSLGASCDTSPASPLPAPPFSACALGCMRCETRCGSSWTRPLWRRRRRSRVRWVSLQR
jgi:hypothetical protein